LLLPVSVVHLFAGAQWSAKESSHDQPVLHGVSLTIGHDTQRIVRADKFAKIRTILAASDHMALDYATLPDGISFAPLLL
jgi:hypothetical protein